MAAPSPPTTSSVESLVTGSASSGVSPKIRYARSCATNGELSRSSSSGALALSIAERTTLAGTRSSRMTPTAAAALRVVRLETASDSDAYSSAVAPPARRMSRSSSGRLSGGGPVARDRVREEHEEQRAERDQEHDREHGRAFRDEVAVAVERSREVEAEHPGAPVRAERLGSDEGGEQGERARADEHVVAVRDQVVRHEAVDDHRDPHRDECREVRDGERDRGQHLVPAAAPEPEHATHREDGQRQHRVGRPLARAVVPAISEIEEPGVRRRSAHVPTPM